jgi:hypothetical protein
MLFVVGDLFELIGGPKKLECTVKLLFFWFWGALLCLLSGLVNIEMMNLSSVPSPPKCSR